MPSRKRAFFFGGGKAEAKGEDLTRNILGGKGVGLMEMAGIGLLVPSGFTISIPTCEEYYKLGRKLPKGLNKEVKEALAKLEKCTGKKFGDANDPLLVSVRSGAARSMPGMLETILNLGLNDQSVEGLAARTGNPRFAYDCYRRFIHMFSTTAMGLSKLPMEEMLHALKNKIGAKTDLDIPADKLKDLCNQFKAFYREKKGDEFPQDPMQQLRGATMAVFNSWESERSVTDRRVQKITDLKGTAVHVMQCVFGNKGETSGTGVCFTRDPNTGENVIYGDCLINAQGEDVVAGLRKPIKVMELKTRLPGAYKQLCDVRGQLEKYYKEMQELAFTIEEGKLYLLQCRTGKRLPVAAVKMIVDMVEEGLITRQEGVLRAPPSEILEKLSWVPEPVALSNAECLCRGIETGTGFVSGQVVFSSARAQEWHAKGRRAILFLHEWQPSDVIGARASVGLLTATGGQSSHAARHARSLGQACIVGSGVDIDRQHECAYFVEKKIAAGDWITLDGDSGTVYRGNIPLIKKTTPELTRLLGWIERLLPQLRMQQESSSPEAMTNLPPEDSKTQ